MEKKFESYYEKEMVYTMTLQELLDASRSEGKNKYRFCEENLLAYIRLCGDRFIAHMNCAAPRDITHTPFGIALVSQSDNKDNCKIVLDYQNGDSLYNPIKGDEEGHWYHAYKIVFTPVAYPGVYEKMYYSDFVSCLNSGAFTLVDPDTGKKVQ